MRYEGKSSEVAGQGRKNLELGELRMSGLMRVK